ncbi:hypothetical protein N7448_009618 [Penicillium atrosanguineum]|nr:hypothetical protein N7448_009618 [Penicillium atrosanguineum]
MTFRGNWRPRGYPSNRRGSNNFRSNNQPETPCLYFQRGRCHYGERCRFLHEVTRATDARPNPKGLQPTADDLDARNQYFDWKRRLRNGISGPGYSRREHEEIFQFWNGALDILESDNRENHQFLVKDLVDDNFHGHELIIATADSDHPEGLQSVSAYDEPFLKVITHPSLLNCLSVDSFVGTLYTSFGGTNGDRAVAFLRSVCRKLINRWEDTGDDVPILPDIMKLLLNALYQLLSRVQRARFHDDLPALLELTRQLVQKLTGTCSKADLDGFESRIEVMQSLITSANRSLAPLRGPEANPQKAGQVQSSFPMDIQIPGGRHDNDLAEISQIQILPTHGEIVSGNSEYLPSTNFLQPHFLADPLQRYIDSMFRLLRHDIFGSAKDALQDLLQQDDLARNPYISGKNSGTRLYLGAKIPHIFINAKNELEANVSFSPPPQLRKKSSSEQCRWWQDSSQLEEGSLVCFLTSQGTQKRLIFFDVTVKNASKDRADQKKKQSLVFLGELYSEKLTGILVDFHGLIPATFTPILRNLQRVQREGELTFRKWVLPGRQDDGDGNNIPPPAYARKPGFVFPLTSITKVGADKVGLDPNTPKTIDILKLQTQTGLDHGQCQGLIAALTREYALIQGPPGTGKSYVGVKLVQALLDIKSQTKLGPILVICYTNHALDQFLKHLLDVGIEKIMRIGGRSQATELEGKNLRVVSKTIGKTRVESQTLGKNYGELEECMKQAGYSIKPLHQFQKGLTWAALEHFLRRKWPIIHRQLEQPDLEGFQTVTDDVLLSWLGVKSLKSQTAQGENEVDNLRFEGLTRSAEQNIHSLSMPERRILAISWFKLWQKSETASLFEALDRAAKLRGEINAVHEEINRRALIQADVVGITTTGLARNIETLRRIGTKVIICEEAAEVMEPHVISALMPGVEHFIQIGDHRQLRPQIQNHSLSLETPIGRNWQLDRSQFERRAVGEPGLRPVSVAQLNVQRRMRPEISQLIRSVYPKLEDHESVTALPNVVGMRHNLFWLDHRCDEDSRDDGSRVKSHSNQWEVDMATALVRHLVRQGEYKSTDIALLTPYTGQLRKLRASLSNDFEICLSERDLETLAADGLETFEDETRNPLENETPQPQGKRTIEKKTLLQTLRLATVDNFQGEEAKVIVVSLVRSNSKRQVGFLRTENRINVLLSRAQHGMYLIGNAETYLNVPMWADVHSQLARTNAVGTELALCCPRHSDTPILCSEPQDFERKSPEGGCSLPCDRRLEPCGHQCQAKCHSSVMHDGFACGKPCPRIRSSCEHKCPKLCGEDCGLCMTRINDVELPCGHIKNTVMCHQMHNLKAIKCDVKVEKTAPKCAHKVQVGCFMDVTSELFLLAPAEGVSRNLMRGRKCLSIQSAREGVIVHTVSAITGVPRNAMMEKAAVIARQSARFNVHTHSATQAAEKHVHRASKDVPGHAFTKVPAQCHAQHHVTDFLATHDNLCQECSDKGDARVDFLEMKPYSKINLDKNPIIVLGCGHFFTSESIDGMVGLDEVYTRDKDGKFGGLRDISASLASAVPSCPDCKLPIRQFVTKRYNRVINRAVMDETCKRFLTKGRADLENLQSRLNNIEADFNPTKFAPSTSEKLRTSSKFSTRYVNCDRLEKEASAFSKMMEAEHQPTKRLIDAIAIYQLSPRDDIVSISAQMNAMKIAKREPDKQITLSARLIGIKALEIKFSDICGLISSSGISAISARLKLPQNSLTLFLKNCRDLIVQANEGSLTRIVIVATLSFAKVAQMDRWYHRTHPEETPNDPHLKEGYKGLENLENRAETTRNLLDAALKLCDRLENFPELQEKVQEMARLYEGPRYEEVTLKELHSIKTAMVSGRRGIATHSGHWYNCVNGHPFAIGECGMPMEQARCPECGAPIGGQNHTAVEGVSRAREME